MMIFSTTIWRNHKRTLLAAVFIFLYSFSITLAVPPTTKYQPGATLDPACAPGDTNCSVQILPDQTSNANKYLTTDGSSTAWSSSTLVLGGNFTTSGAYATTLTATGTTTLTLPTSGTLATTGNLSQFAATTSAQLAGVISDETGTGLAVFATSPTFTTSISTPSIITASGALGITPASGSNLNITLATTGDFAVNTNQLYVDTSTGNVGVGTSAPAGKVHIQTSSTGVTPNTSAADLVVENNSNAGISILGGNTSSGYLVFGDNDSNATGIIQYLHSDPSLRIRALEASAYLTLSTNNTERFRIDSSGNVIVSDLAGVGNRCVYADTNGQLGVKSDDCGLASGGDDMGDHTATQNIILGSNWLSGDGGNEGIKIDSSGNVGVGTASPAYTLDVAGVVNIPNGYQYQWGDGTTQMYGSSLGTSDYIVLQTNTAERMRIDASGNVGIGAASPFGLTHIKSGASGQIAAVSYADELVIEGSGNTGLTILAPSGNASNIVFGDEGSNTVGYISYLHTTDQLQFYVNAAQRMVIDNAGNIGIGTTTPASTLPNGFSSGTILEVGKTSGNAGIALRRTDAQGIGLDLWYSSGTGSSYIDNRYNDNTGNIYFRTKTSSTAVDAMTILGSGNVGIGTTSPNRKLSIKGFVGFEATNSTNDWILYTHTDNTFRINYNGAGNDELVMDSSGNLGIGTASPGSLLDVSSATGAATITPTTIRISSVADSQAWDTTNTWGNLDFYNTDTGGLGSAVKARIGTRFIDSSGSATAIDFSTTNGSTLSSRMTINNAGYVGIGTTSPGAPLQVDISSSGGRIMDLGTGSGNSPVYQYIHTGNGGSQGYFGSEGVAGGVMFTGTASYSMALGTVTSTSLHLATEGTVRQTIDASGNFVLNGYEPVTSYLAGYKTFNAGGFGVMYRSEYDSYIMSNAQYNSSSTITAKYSTAEGMAQMTFGGGSLRWTTYNGSVTAGSTYTLSHKFVVTAAGAVSFGAYGAGTLVTDSSGNITASSDERLKDVEGNFEDGLESIRGLNPILYKWNTLSGMERRDTYIGFSAQNVRDFIPAAVDTDPRGYYTLQDRPIMAVMVNAIKELDIKVQAIPEFDDDGSMAQVVADFLRGIATGIANVGQVNTDTLCVGQTCVTENELQQLLNNANVSGGGGSDSGGGDPVPDPIPEPVPDEGGDIVPEEIPEPEAPPAEEPPAEEPIPEAPAPESA